MADKPLTSRQLQAQESRKKIFDAAVSLFDQKGYGNVSVAEICEEAGFATGSFYYHFESKDQVMRERYLPVKDIDSVYDAMYEAIKQKGKSNYEQLVEFGQLILVGLSSMGAEASMIVAFVSQVGPGYVSTKTNLSLLHPYNVVSRIIEEGQRAGEFRTDVSAEAVTQIIIHSILGAVFDWIVRDGSFDLPQAGDECFKLLLSGFSAK